MSNDSDIQTLESMSQAVWYNRWIVGKFDKYLKGKILEVGCGIGNFTKILTNYGEVFAIDIDRYYIAEVGKAVGDRVKVQLGDIGKSTDFFNGQKFDSIICLNVLEHIKEDKDALKNLYYLLNKEGILVLLVPAHDFLFGKIDKSIGHYRRYDKAKLNKLVTNVGFKIINERIMNMLGGIGWWFSSKLFVNSKVDTNKIKIFNLLAPIILPIEDMIEPPMGTSILMVAQK
ncbi:MAG: class I SAM-dependent methyltransferase [Actinobacteria bacterium]|nr:class I SAM-dependent methyltransferase [Actinomycetota bacterium]